MLPLNAYQGPLSKRLNSLSPDWQAVLHTPAVQEALSGLDSFLAQRLAQGATIFPASPFRALQGLAPEKVHVVILGQDPYHGPGQAQGLAFSVPDHCPCPPSLRNIFTELKREFPEQMTVQSHDLTRWAEQGVLLLNTVLTVEEGKPASHARQGWEIVTDALIQHIVRRPQPKVFMLWGNHAQQKRGLIAPDDNTLVLCANHPSPLSARRPPTPFIGCDHFIEANRWLKTRSNNGIAWL